MDPRMFDGIGKAIGILIAIVAVSVPLGLWRLAELAIWCWNHI